MKSFGNSFFFFLYVSVKSRSAFQPVSTISKSSFERQYNFFSLSAALRQASSGVETRCCGTMCYEYWYSYNLFKQNVDQIINGTRQS